MKDFTFELASIYTYVSDLYTFRLPKIIFVYGRYEVWVLC